MFFIVFVVNVNAKIAFESSGEEHGGIFVMDDNGRNIKQLTQAPNQDIYPRWSPDGKRIVFERVVTPDLQWGHLFIMDADGTNLSQLTNNFGINTFPSFSPDGKRIVFTSDFDGKNGVYVMDLENKDIKKISDFLANYPEWSPDGKHIVFSNQGNIWIMNANGENARRLLPPIPEGKRIIRQEPRWSPNGKHILYKEGEFELVQIGPGKWKSIPLAFRYLICDQNGNIVKQLEIQNDWKLGSIAWMDDGKAVLFSADADLDPDQPNDHPDRTYDFYRYHIATDKVKRITTRMEKFMGGDWVSGTLSVSPQGKMPVQWGGLKTFLQVMTVDIVKMLSIFNNIRVLSVIGF